MTSSLIHRPFQAALANMFADCETVLDVGCGPGQYREALGGRYLGMDLTSEAYKDGVARGTDIVGDARKIPLLTGSIDAVFSVAVIYQVPDISSAISEIFRVLKPGGKFLLFDYNWRTLRRLADTESAGSSYKREFRTQLGWKRELAHNGFVETRLWLEPEFEGRSFGAISRKLRLLRNELRNGGWACISGSKPDG